MTILTVIALADLRDRIAAAADMLNRVAGNLAGCLRKTAAPIASATSIAECASPAT
jgi:hypothetical protein